MDIIIVDCLRKFKLRVYPAIKRGTLIFFTYINMAPVVKWFNVLHPPIILKFFLLTVRSGYKKAYIQAGHNLLRIYRKAIAIYSLHNALSKYFFIVQLLIFNT